jgi:hypothetical protein
MDIITEKRLPAYASTMKDANRLRMCPGFRPAENNKGKREGGGVRGSGVRRGDSDLPRTTVHSE